MTHASRSVGGWLARLAAQRRLAMVLLCVAIAGALAHGLDRRPAPPRVGRSATSLDEGALMSDVIRIATFNIHGGVGRDGRGDLGRIARCLQGFDLVGLNEVRQDWLRGNQAQRLGEELGLRCRFAPSEIRWWHGHFGNAVLSRADAARWSSVPLVGTRGKGYRNMLLVDVPCRSAILHLLVTHLDRGPDRAVQLQEVIERFLALPRPAALLGDLNSTGRDPQLARLLARPDVGNPIGEQTGASDDDHIDWILTRGLDALAAGMIDEGASDHPCYWAELRIRSDKSVTLDHTDTKSPVSSWVSRP
jgi:endonuclease/exonuclease/phosphatase family metal-dependent hydrolase